MAKKKKGGLYEARTEKARVRRKGVHSKNASKGQTKYKQKSRGQGKNR
jgi:endonuclease YncB( thermonuclease family)